jgi:hypothetical protein
MTLAVAGVLTISYDWPLVHDASLIHYVVFLMDRGWVPYRDIVEMNMPGAYIAESWAMHLFGGDAFGWWLWDALLGLSVIGGSILIAGMPRKWAGLIAGSLVYLSHLKDGPADLGQRDWLVTALLVLSVGCLFEAIRKRQPVWMAGFMFLCAAAASIKPPAILLGGTLLLAACWQQRLALHSTGQSTVSARLGALVAWSATGALAVTIILAAYLAQWGASRDFVSLLRGLIPYYAGLHQIGLWQLVSDVFIYKALVLCALFAFFKGQSWRRWDSIFLLLAAATGALLFIIQYKGWSYHLYTERAFIALWAVLELERVIIQGGKWERRCASVALTVSLLLLVPLLVLKTHRANYPVAPLEHLEADLSSLGGARLSGQVQCLDMTMGGCINALYRLNIVQTTGFIYDFYLFPAEPTAVTASLQQRFLAEIRSAPPRLIVISTQTWPEETYSYKKIDRWPDFKNFLRENYDVEREFSALNLAGYRIYAQKRRHEK